MQRIKSNRKTIALLLAVVLMCTAFVGAAIANDVPGDVTVVTPKLTLSNLVVPATINPLETTLIQVNMADVDKITVMQYMYIDAWHSSVLETDPFDPATRYTALAVKAGVSAGDDNPDGWIVSAPNIELMTTVTFYIYELEVQFQNVALAGSWTFKLRTVETPTLDESEIQSSFVMNGLLSLTVEEASFSFGEVQQGMFDIAIINPMSGYLTMQIVSNYEAKLQVSGTDPTSSGGSFSVDQIKVSDAGIIGDAALLTSIPADLNSAMYLGTNIVHLYLWISVPVTASLGIHTMTLSIVLIAG